MGFRSGAYAKVWEKSSVGDTSTKLRISISRKIKDVFEQDFSGYVSFVGTANAKKAACLPDGARIKIGDCDVSTRYDAIKKISYTNYKVFSFEEAEQSKTPADSVEEIESSVGDGELDDSNLPF